MRPHPKNVPAIELCAWVRIRTDGGVSIPTWLGSIQEVSSRGITLNMRRRFAPATILSVQLESNANEPRRLVVRVLNARRQVDGGWLIGCAFETPLMEAELETFLGE
jgi:hypothetical protein